MLWALGKGMVRADFLEGADHAGDSQGKKIKCEGRRRGTGEERELGGRKRGAGFREMSISGLPLALATGFFGFLFFGCTTQLAGS